MMHTRAPIKPLPYTIYFWTLAALAVAGLLNSVYLAASHYRVYTDIAYKSFCAISRSINCDTVSQSPYSIFLGVPVPVWGIIGYTFFLLFLAIAWKYRDEKKPIWTLLFLVSLGFSAYSVVLALISSFIIHSYCVMCILSYAISFMLLFFTYLIRKRYAIRGLAENLIYDIARVWKAKRRSLALFVPFSLALVLVLLFFPVYWNFDPPVFSADIPHGMTADGHPWIGAEDPKLEIIEFADYQCFQCNKMHFFLRQTLAQYPDRIRVIHRHFPMDHEVNPLLKTPEHIGSGKLAMLSIYAATQDRFWQMNDILFSIARVTPEIDVKKLAHDVGLDERKLGRAFQNRKVRYKLKKDILEGIKMGVRGTPSFVIDGKVYQGQIPPEIIKKALE
jgi:uncharacterized membrane protein/predicted DsbA family dithiol-disulfide isomerase